MPLRQERAQLGFDLRIRDCARALIARGAERGGVHVRTEGDDGNTALYQLADSRLHVRFAQFHNRQVERLIAHRFRACSAHDLLQLPTEEQIAAILHEWDAGAKVAERRVPFPLRPKGERW